MRAYWEDIDIILCDVLKKTVMHYVSLECGSVLRNISQVAGEKFLDNYNTSTRCLLCSRCYIFCGSRVIALASDIYGSLKITSRTCDLSCVAGKILNKYTTNRYNERDLHNVDLTKNFPRWESTYDRPHSVCSSEYVKWTSNILREAGVDR